MAMLYADEDFPLPVVEALRHLGNDVRTSDEAGRANRPIDDFEVLADAVADGRIALTHNHGDFKRLHRLGQPHLGIVSCTHDPRNPTELARRIHAAISPISDLANRFVRVVRPNPSMKP